MIVRLRNLQNPLKVVEVEVEDLSSGWFQDSKWYPKTEWEEVLKKPVQNEKGNYVPPGY